MTDPNYTDLTMILDRSGSMQAIQQDMIGGFNAFIAEQAAQPGRCTVTLHQFDDQYETVYEELSAEKVPSLVLTPRGRTALLDAIGRSIVRTGERLAAKPEHERPGNVIIGIITDGLENSSKEFSHEAIRNQITEQESTYSWSFSYLGANQDAVEVGRGLGIRPEAAMTYASADNAMSAYTTSISAIRQAVASGASPAAARSAGAYTEQQRADAMVDPGTATNTPTAGTQQLGEPASAGSSPDLRETEQAGTEQAETQKPSTEMPDPQEPKRRAPVLPLLERGLQWLFPKR